MVDSIKTQSSIMFTDMVGYSRMVSKDQDHALKLLDEHNDLLISLINKFNGKVIKLIGDAIFAHFTMAEEAALCAMEIQTKILKRNKLAHAKDQFKIRIGLHQGQVVVKGDDLFGNDVNLGSRIEGIAPHDGIAISELFFNKIEEIQNMWMREMGYVKLKNIVTPQKIYKLYLNKQDYQKESPSELREKQESHGITFVDMEGYDESQIKSVAILYLDNLGSEEDEMLCHSISDKMIDDLKKVSSIRSPSFNTVQKYKNSDLPLSEIARRLNVENIVNGSMLKVEDKFKVKLEMLNTVSGEISWSEKWEGSTKFTGTMNGQMISGILESLDVSVPEHVKRYFTYKMTENTKANELYVKGRYALEYRTSQEQLKEAEQYFVSAIKLDDQFVEAYANLGMVYQWMYQFEKAEEELESALRLAKKSYNDPGLAYIYNLLGIFYTRAQKFSKAIRHYEKGLELQIQLQDRFGEGKILQNMGHCYSSMQNTNKEKDLDKAKYYVEKAIEVNASLEEELATGNALAILGNIHKNLSQFSEALEYHRKALAMYRKIDEVVNAHRILFVIYDTYIKLGMYDETSQFFIDAEYFESNFDDYYILGRSYFISSEINRWKGDFRNAEYDLDEAIDNFESADKDHHLLSIYNHMVCYYLNKIKFEKIRKILKKSERISHKVRDEYLIFRVNLIKDYVKCFNNDPDMDALNNHLKHVSANDCFVEDWWILSQCYKYSGNIDQSRDLLKNAQKIILDESKKISDPIQRKSFLNEQMFNKEVLNDDILD